MTQLNSHRQPHRGRLFPERTISVEEQAKRQAELEEFQQRGRVIFEKLRPELIEKHYNWFIYIEPHSGDYFIAPDSMVAIQQALEKYPQGRFATFRLNETGVCGRI
ncbi:hypothetical protein FACHB389_10145 [Nostoc calcicola FACHB-389]|nr:hypothetical protein [Nostoc calcicola FACHB-3891]OKH37476.1 hypothetical protein FACHB389_10145 [Nostoc calcicola FACHB-389]